MNARTKALKGKTRENVGDLRTTGRKVDSGAEREQSGKRPWLFDERSK